MQKQSRTRKAFAWSSALVLALTLGTWLSTGASRGWTRTQITEMHHDEITGIDYPEQKPGFAAGIDLLLAGTGLALALAAPALLLRRKQSPQVARTIPGPQV